MSSSLEPARRRWPSGALGNAWNVPLLGATFPDARFVYLYREPHEQLERRLAGGAEARESAVRRWLSATSRLARGAHAGAFPAFSGIEIAELPLERCRSGVWVVDIETGKTVAFVEFQGQAARVDCGMERRRVTSPLAAGSRVRSAP